ncbi:energy transducer TonB [Novosphingobium sp. FKTRR1]|uniref:energy transducer TonB n=1 Tax=Novosphingobium sp. FKTRR1 TaxID=2879118 RepID=UPI001CEFDA37|nr:energy transducer TonB [Novosphingobium sp. FKTRR1]
MSSLAVLASPPRMALARPASQSEVPVRVVVPANDGWEPSAYTPGSRSRLGAGAAALAVVGGLFLALMSAGVIGGKAERTVVTAVRLSQDLPPPPPPPAEASALRPDRPVSPLAAPPPLVSLPAPVEIAAPMPVAPAPQPSAPAPVQAAAPAPVIAPAPAPAAVATMATGRDLTANLIAAQAPRYPIDSRRNREQGTVVLLVTVGLDGKVAAISLSRSSGFDRLDRAALGAVRQWRWSPTREAGIAMMVQGLVQIPFVLQG